MYYEFLGCLKYFKISIRKHFSYNEPSNEPIKLVLMALKFYLNFETFFTGKVTGRGGKDSSSR